MPIERAIAESRFAYGAKSESLGMSAPPGTLPLTTFGRPIAQLFERAFAPPGGEVERPSAIEWIEALQGLENQLVACPLRPRHFHPRGAACCWCDVERRTGAKLFDDGQTANADSDAVTAQELWDAIEVVRPPMDPELPAFAWQEGSEITGRTSWRERFEHFRQAISVVFVSYVVAQVLGTNAGILLSVLGLSLLIGSKVVASRHGRLFSPSRTGRALRIEWQNAITQWRIHSSSALFAGARSQLEKARRSLAVLVDKQRQELARLERVLEPRQRERFLDAFEIDKALFLEVTRSHVVKMATRGIRTAGDVRRHRYKVVDMIPGAAMEELRAWAAQCLNDYKFDKSEATYLADAAKIDEKYRQERQHLLEELRRGPALLEAKRIEVADARARAEDVLRRKHENLRRRREEEKH
jgi:DNA-binding helix-hairpin-helix protein with protein kinase domain